MKKILIPTDFRKESLLLIEEAARAFSDDQLDIVLGLGYRLPENRLGILSFKPQRFANQEMSPAFKEQLKYIREKYTQKIRSVQVEFFCGSNIIAFENYLSMNDIDRALIPADGFLKYEDSRFFGISKSIRKSAIQVKEVDLVNIEDMSTETIRELSFSNM